MRRFSEAIEEQSRALEYAIRPVRIEAARVDLIAKPDRAVEVSHTLHDGFLKDFLGQTQGGRKALSTIAVEVRGIRNELQSAQVQFIASFLPPRPEQPTDQEPLAPDQEPPVPLRVTGGVVQWEPSPDDDAVLRATAPRLIPVAIALGKCLRAACMGLAESRTTAQIVWGALGTATYTIGRVLADGDVSFAMCAEEFGTLAKSITDANQRQLYQPRTSEGQAPGHWRTPDAAVFNDVRAFRVNSTTEIRKFTETAEILWGALGTVTYTIGRVLDPDAEVGSKI
jgi:hypothetical protein